MRALHVICRVNDQSDIVMGTVILQIQRKFNKVFVIGGHKNGSLTLHNYFLALGFRSVHGQFWKNNPAVIDSHDCFSDHFAEFQEDTRELDKLVQSYPDSKFVLNFRELDSYIRSLCKHLALNTELGLPFNFSDVDEVAVIGRIEKTHRFHQLALDYFTQLKLDDDVLVINVCNGENAKNKQLLDQFLGICGNSTQLPHSNHFDHVTNDQQTEFLAKHADRLRYVIEHVRIQADEYAERLNELYTARARTLIF